MSAPTHSVNWRVNANHPSLAGHFPANPVVPGVMIVDAVLAAASATLGAGWQLRGLPQVKFLLPLLPEQSATIELTVVAALSGQQRLRFRVLRETALLASGELRLEHTEPAP